MRVPGTRPLWDEMQASGFAPFDGVTLVAIGKPWRPRGSMLPAASLTQGGFERFAEPGWAKMGIGFRVEYGRLVTETRVQLTDEAARRAFGRYWLVVRPFSGLTRRSWLKAAKRRAETA